MSCFEFNARVAVDLPHGTTLYGFASGCVFGDCTSTHEHFVRTDTAIWADGTVKRFAASAAGKFWGVRALTDAEAARERREQERAEALVD